MLSKTCSTVPGLVPIGNRQRSLVYQSEILLKEVYSIVMCQGSDSRIWKERVSGFVALRPWGRSHLLEP